MARNKGGIRFLEEKLRVLGDRDGATYRWVPNLLVNACPAVWLGVGKLIRSRGRAPSARHRLRGHLGHKIHLQGRKCSKNVIFGSIWVWQPLRGPNACRCKRVACYLVSRIHGVLFMLCRRHLTLDLHPSTWESDVRGKSVWELGCATACLREAPKWSSP